MKVRYKILQDILLQNNHSLSNKVCSPQSLLTFLDIIACYSDPDLKEKINEILKDFNYSRKAFLRAIKDLENTETKLHSASSFWYRQDLAPKNIKFPNFETFEVDFTRKTSLQLINSWVSEKTNKLIDKVDVSIPSSYLNSVLISTLYFKSFWINEFETPTYPEEFYLLNGMKVNVGYLSKCNKEPISFLKGKNFQVIALPYKDNNIQFEVYLPDKEVDFMNFISNLDLLDLTTINSNFKEVSNYLISIPKFEVSSEIDLNPILKGNNLNQLFELNNSPYFIEKIEGNSLIKQEVMVKINEKGTEAAAVTYEVDLRGLPIFEVEFIANRPFLFLIRENNSNSILFLGIVTKPKEFNPSDNLWHKIKKLFSRF